MSTNADLCSELNEQLRTVRLELAAAKKQIEEQDWELTRLRNDNRNLTADRDRWRLKAMAAQHGARD